ncbi:ATP-binding protein [Herminiimonas arsenitoxidans]|uniref:ATP-binding protein n=1 Tax=Herminiimonas arsenitoxidans TaxID=1809410 RepID=UPI0009712B80|nr:ATP-binding protein [Herminiimonas arsenitoxidans]
MPESINTGDPAVIGRAEPCELSSRRREQLLEFHPLLERGYTLPTPMLERTYRIAREKVWTRRTGVVFYATPRMGKTTCAKEIQNLLNSEFPRTYTLLLSARRSKQSSEYHMYSLILEAKKHILSSRTKVGFLLENIKTDTILKLSKIGGSQFVLIVDEAQLLSDTDLEQLFVLHNALDLMKIKMTTIFFAQPQIMHRRAALLVSGQHQIIARFLSEPIAFEGCSSMIELQLLLKAYDEQSEYPEGSGWSYTRFFLPEAFAKGFRLHRYASKLWEALAAAAGPLGLGMVPMEHVCLSIEYLLLASKKEDCSNFSISDSDIAIAVESSNLASFSALLQSPSKEGGWEQ